MQKDCVGCRAPRAQIIHMRLSGRLTMMSYIEAGSTDAWMHICMNASCLNGSSHASTSTSRQAQGDPPGCRDQDVKINVSEGLPVTTP